MPHTLIATIIFITRRHGAIATLILLLLAIDTPLLLRYAAISARCYAIAYAIDYATAAAITIRHYHCHYARYYDTYIALHFPSARYYAITFTDTLPLLRDILLFLLLLY